MSNSISDPSALSTLNRRRKGTKDELAFDPNDLVGEKNTLDPQAFQNHMDQKELLQLTHWAKKEYERCKQERNAAELQWNLNLSFFKGDQYVDIIQNSLVKIPAPAARVRLVVNRIRPMVRTEIARLTSQDPTAEVVPATSDEEDKMKAKAAEAVFLHLQETRNLRSVIRQTAMWSSICGLSYIKTIWDPTESYMNPEETEEYRGNVTFSSVSPYHVFVPDLMSNEIEDQPYIFNAFTKSEEWVRTRYQDMLPEDWTPSTASSDDVLKAQYLNVGVGKSEKNSSLILEVWVKPNGHRLFPNGGMFTMVDDLIVAMYDKGMPYTHGEYPFAKHENVQSGTYYTTSAIEDLIPIQRELNRNRSQLVEARNKMGSPGYFYTEGSLNPKMWSSKPGILIPVKPGMPTPQPIQAPEIPSYIQNEHETLKADFEDLSGQHQVSKGTTPAGVTAATAIQFLQEQDTSFMSAAFDSLEEMVQKVARQSLQLFVEFVENERMIKVTGKKKETSVQMLAGADIRGATDVRIERGSGLPTSRAARIALFMDLISKGIIDPQQGLELMDLANMDAYWEITKIDENQAERENIQMKTLDGEEMDMLHQQMDERIKQLDFEQGQEETATMNDVQLETLKDVFRSPFVAVNEWDNHEVHIEIHNRFRKSEAFEMLPQPVKEEFNRHVEEHEKQMQGAMLQQMLQQAISGGQGGASGMDAEIEAATMEEMGGAPNPEGANQFSGIEEEQAPVDMDGPVQ